MSDSARKGPGDGRIAFGRHSVFAFLRTYSVLIMIVALMVFLPIIGDAFPTPRNLLNILNQNSPLKIIAAALTLMIIGGGFDLFNGAIFGAASVAAAGVTVNVNPQLGILAAPFVGLASVLPWGP